MFKKQFSVPEKQTSITQEQILHDIEAIRKTSDEMNNAGKSEEWYTDLRDFNSVSHNLVGALDDGGDLRDQLQTMEKDLKKISDKIRVQVHDILEAKK